MTERPLTLASLNVRGFGKDSPKQKVIKAWVASLQTPPQILLLQEHHLDVADTTNSMKGIKFWKGRAFWNPGIPMGCLQRKNTSTSILVDMTITPLVKVNGILLEGRAHFITLHLPNNGSLTIINVYAPKSSNDKAPLWRRISAAEFISDHLVLGGNFNHLEKVSCRGLVGERQMHKREVAFWHHMTFQYGLANIWNLDSFCKMSKKGFTFNNGRSGPRSAVSRIDKFLVTQELDSRGGRIETARR
jgi:hypothetical protein